LVLRGVGGGARAAEDDRQIEGLNEEFGLLLLVLAGLRIVDALPGQRILFRLVVLIQTLADGGQLLDRNAGELPCDRRRVALEKCESKLRLAPQIETRTGE
jgi:hypothetical protein